jgi:hypothetical protein
MSSKCMYMIPRGELKFQLCGNNISLNSEHCNFHKSINKEAKLWALCIRPTQNDSQIMYNKFPKENYQEYQDWYEDTGKYE